MQQAAGCKWNYDALNRLRSERYKLPAWPADSLMARYGYDVLGRRIARRVYRAASGGTVQYLRMIYHGSQVAYEADSAGTTGWRYVWSLGTDRLAVADSAGVKYYPVLDRVGSIRGLVAGDGAWKWYQWWTPYAEGRTQEGSGPALRYGWTGREYDAETGFYYLRARYYDPRQRRFTQEDPLGFGGGRNVYAYVAGQALEARDPSGLLMDFNYFGGNPHDWSGIPGLNPDGSSASGGGGDFSDSGWDDPEFWGIEDDEGPICRVWGTDGKTCELRSEGAEYVPSEGGWISGWGAAERATFEGLLLLGSLESGEGAPLFTGVTKDFVTRAIERGIGPQAILDALRNPLRVIDRGLDASGRLSLQYIGRGATVVRNPETGTLVTLWRTGTDMLRRVLRSIGGP